MAEYQMGDLLQMALASLGNALEALNKEPGCEGPSGHRSRAIACIHKARLRIDAAYDEMDAVNCAST